MTVDRHYGRSGEFLASRRAYLALPLLMAAPAIGQAQVERQAQPPTAQIENGRKTAHLHPDSTIRDLLEHPAFAGFSRRILPWDDRHYDESAKLDSIASLLPYHSQIDIPSTLGALNRLIDDDAKGWRISFDIYTQAQKRQDPTKANTGLFLIRGQPGEPFAIIAPGGGFAYVGSVHEGFPYALEIAKAGFNAIVLKYRVGQGGQVANADLAAAIGYVFRNADALGVSTRDYSLWGSSAGARMAASIGSHGTARFGGEELPKPSAVVMAYTAHADLARQEPPTFVVAGERDGIAPAVTMKKRVDALRRLGTPVVYREYPGLGHGFGLGIGTSAEGWVGEALAFCRQHQSR